LLRRRIKDVLIAATVLDAQGTRHRLGAELELAYRSTILQRNEVIAGVRQCDRTAAALA
jgi:UDP-N-acetylenolpyruvoylglucosamine reductase